MFIAVIAKSTRPEKPTLIKHSGGECLLVDSTDMIYAQAEKFAVQLKVIIWISLPSRSVQWIGVVVMILQTLFLRRCHLSDTL